MWLIPRWSSAFRRCSPRMRGGSSSVRGVWTSAPWTLAASWLVACSSMHSGVPSVAPVEVELREADGTILTATYFAANRPGPGIVLFHQSNRNRSSWSVLANQLAAAGIHALAVDARGGKRPSDRKTEREQILPADVDAAFQYLVARPGVDRSRIGAGGAGWLGVDHAVELARRHPGEVRSLFA